MENVQKDRNEIIQAYFFCKSSFLEKDIIKWLIENDIPTIQNISEGQFYRKIKLYSEKKLKLQGYNIIKKQYKPGIKINLAVKIPVKVNNYVIF